MKLLHRKMAWLVVFLMVLAIVALPGTAFAAPGSPAAAQGNADQTQTGGSKIDVPGILSLVLGAGMAPQIDVPALNATVGVDGLNFANGLSWKSISLNQKSPAKVQDWTISGAQAQIGSLANGYTSAVSGHLALQPAAATSPLVEGTVALTYDGVDKLLGLGVQDGNAYFAAGPAVVTVAGLNRLPGNTSVETVNVDVPATNGNLQIQGLNNTSGKADWDSLTVSQGSTLALGNLGTLSGLQVNVNGPSSGYSTDATLHYTLGNGQVAQAEGQLVMNYDGVNRKTTLSLHDATASVNAPSFNLAAAGMDYGTSGMQIDSITFQAPGANVSGELDNVTMAPGGGVSFDKAAVRYTPPAPAAGTGKSNLAGFEFIVTKTDAGYLLSTNTLVSPAQ